MTRWLWLPLAALALWGCGMIHRKPAWIYTESGVAKDGHGVPFFYGVGSAQGGGGDLRMLRKMATADARANLAACLKTHSKELVESLRKIEGAQGGALSTERLDQLTASQFTDADLPPHVCDEMWPADPEEQLKEDRLLVRCRIDNDGLKELAASLPLGAPPKTLDKDANQAFQGLKGDGR